MSTFVYPALSVNTTGLATESKQDDAIVELQNIEAELSLDVVDQIDVTPLLSVTITNIPASSGNPVSIVNSLAADVKKIISVEDIGEFIGIYEGAALSETLIAVLPLGGGSVDVQIPAGTRISLRHMKNTAITADFISINFLG